MIIGLNVMVIKFFISGYEFFVCFFIKVVIICMKKSRVWIIVIVCDFNFVFLYFLECFWYYVRVIGCVCGGFLWRFDIVLLVSVIFYLIFFVSVWKLSNECLFI